MSTSPVKRPISADTIKAANAPLEAALAADYDALGTQLARRNVDIEAITAAVGKFGVAIPSWGDGANFPGQQHLVRAYERYLDSASKIYAALPAEWRLLIEHKMYEPAFYATVIQDWGSSLLAAQTLGPKAFCLVDLGHHAPNVNI